MPKRIYTFLSFFLKPWNSRKRKKKIDKSDKRGCRDENKVKHFHSLASKPLTVSNLFFTWGDQTNLFSFEQKLWLFIMWWEFANEVVFSWMRERTGLLHVHKSNKTQICVRVGRITQKVKSERKKVFNSFLNYVLITLQRTLIFHQ